MDVRINFYLSIFKNTELIPTELIIEDNNKM